MPDNKTDDLEIPDDVTAHECFLASHKSLAKIWCNPEEDEAWKYLEDTNGNN